MVKQKIRKRKIIIVFFFFIGMIGLGLFSYDYVLSKINLAFETANLKLYGHNKAKETKEENITPNNNESQKQATIAEPTTIKNNYIGYIEIPIINLNQGLVSMDDPNNNVDKNIQTIYPSDYPDVDQGNLILAAHSGTSSISYFKNLYKLNVNDIVNIYYNNTKYVYKIANIYTVPKNGEVAIYRDTNITTLTLITCTKNNDTLQTVYIAYLTNKETIQWMALLTL